MERRIQKISEDVQQRVRGGSIAPDIGAILLQLIYNSVDAGAAMIAIRVDLENMLVQVTDDGHGIVSADMYNVAKRGYTSRLREKSDLERNDFQYFGYRGESLSSISEFCELEITSRNMHEKDSFRKVMKGGKAVSFSSLVGSGPVGTSVVCRDLFYNRPVARKIISKQIADMYTMKSRRVVIIENLSSLIRSSTVAHPAISFSLHFSPNLQPDLDLPRSRDVLSLQRVGKAFPPHEMFRFTTRHASFSLDVFFGSPWMNSLPRSKDFQLVFFNRRFSSRNPVHKHVNQLYKTCWNSFHPIAALENTHVREFFKFFPQRKKRRAEDNSAVAPCKRYPVFVVDIQCSPLDCSFADCDHGAFVEFAHWEEAFKCLESLFKELCEKVKTMDNQTSNVEMNENQPRNLAPSVKANDDAETKLLERIEKLSYRNVNTSCLEGESSKRKDVQQYRRESSTSLTRQVETELVDQSELDLIEIALQTAHLAKKGNAALSSTKGGRLATAKAPAMSGFQFDIAASQWRVLSTPQGDEGGISLSSSRTLPSSRTSQNFSSRPSETSKTRSSQDLLEEFEKFSRKRSRLSMEGEKSGSRSEGGHVGGRRKDADEGEGASLHDEGTTASRGRSYKSEIISIDNWDASAKMKFALTRDWLRCSSIIGQAFNKFLVAMADGILVLLDQHAVHERARLEALEQSIVSPFLPPQQQRPTSRSGLTGAGRYGEEEWNVQTSPLPAPVRLDGVTKPLRTSLLQHWETIHRWGFKVDEVGRTETCCSSDPSSSSSSSLRTSSSSIPSSSSSFWVVQVPAVMGVQLTPTDLMDFLHELHENVSPAPLVPQAVRRVIISKACRGAVMFGDPLPRDQCTLLLSQLKDCNFPFQCAHGRPTMLPVLDLRGVSSSSSSSFAARSAGLAPPDWILYRRRRSQSNHNKSSNSNNKSSSNSNSNSKNLQST